MQWVRPIPNSWKFLSYLGYVADMSNLSHRHLVEQKWRKDGALDLLVRFFSQLIVIPCSH